MLHVALIVPSARSQDICFATTLFFCLYVCVYVLYVCVVCVPITQNMIIITSHMQAVQSPPRCSAPSFASLVAPETVYPGFGIYVCRGTFMLR